MDKKLIAFERLLNIMDDLREKCPWDRKQTNQSLRNLTIEEVYELADAILENNPDDIKEEIGDIMLHMVFYAKIAEEQNQFDVADAINDLCEKLINRHPHIYGDLEVKNEEEVKRNWEQLKLKEGKKSVLSGVPKSLPAMVKALRLQEKTAQVGFEWDDMGDVLAKVQEEFGELQEAIERKKKGKIEDEFGDVIFALINYARYLDIDPELCLEKTNRKFKSRFEYIESTATKSLAEMNLEEMDELWEKAKTLEIKN